MPLVAHSLSHRGDRREAPDDRARRGGASRARVPRLPRPSSRRARAHRDRRATSWRARSNRKSSDAIVRELKAAGYRYVTIDLQGYRMGSLNEGLLLRPRRRDAQRRCSCSAHSASRRLARSPCCLFLALHLPFLPPSLEDLDSINFALGVRDFDVARHQPHPPGYPVFIAAAKAVRAIVPRSPGAQPRRHRWPARSASLRWSRCSRASTPSARGHWPAAAAR